MNVAALVAVTVTISWVGPLSITSLDPFAMLTIDAGVNVTVPGLTLSVLSVVLIPKLVLVPRNAISSAVSDSAAASDVAFRKRT